jgi:hypothetical protein
MKPGDKADLIRLLDVVAIGPAMVYAGLSLRGRDRELGAFLVVSGIGTITYNLRNLVDSLDAREGKS